MSIASRSNLILFIWAAVLLTNWLFDEYEKWTLPSWLKFTQSDYGLFAGSQLSTFLILGLFYLLHREFQETEEISGRFKTILKWLFYGMLGVTAVGIPLEIAAFLMKLHANG
ncbi:hypothetical protein KXS07_23460 [Inquilinus limosus]|uniref:hypothetical protein n=1 Tax=Inquilinus limosus TaxID=171674 RepID=UPI003F14ECB3